MIKALNLINSVIILSSQPNPSHSSAARFFLAAPGIIRQTS
jgi:hypothetical protein